MNIQPLTDCVLIKQDVERHAFLVMPESRKLFSGIIVAAGPGKRTEDGRNVPMEVAVGDHVMFGEWSGQKVNHEGEEFLVMREPDVIGILND